MFPPDDLRLVGAGADQRVFSWDLDPAVARERICSSIGQSITEEEWLRIVPALDYADQCAT
ncbi:MAG: hypothetical protein AAGA42_07065 [Actinomycetota bacterium]